MDFEANPDKVDEPTYAVRSALGFGVEKKLYEHADAGINRDAADKITAVINKGTDSYGDRWDNVEEIGEVKFFKMPSENHENPRVLS